MEMQYGVIYAKIIKHEIYHMKIILQHEIFTIAAREKN